MSKKVFAITIKSFFILAVSNKSVPLDINCCCFSALFKMMYSTNNSLINTTVLQFAKTHLGLGHLKSVFPYLYK